MGIHGLTTFLRENKRNLSKALHFSSSDEQSTPFVVDGWSFIYKIVYDSNLPWVYGGEYAALTELIVKVIKAWIAVKIRPIFVFDGSTPPLKFETVISRLNQVQVQHSLLYFRTSPASRNTRRFLNETSILPPLTYSVCIHVLQSLRESLVSSDGEDVLEVHFADEEADPYIVELAGQLNGYVTGQDSDFVILNSEGFAGYLPLDELLWIGSEDVKEEQAQNNDNGFTSVKTKKRVIPENVTGTGLIPPASDNLTLLASLYTPLSLSKFLNLPVSLLPLLGALVGNDFTKQKSNLDMFGPPSSSPRSFKSFHNLLYERRLNLSERILRASAVLGDLLRPAAGPHVAKHVPLSVAQLIERAIVVLAASSRVPAALVGPREIAVMVETVAEATLPYALPSRPSPEEQPIKALCPLHLPAQCKLVALFDRSTRHLSSGASEVGTLYLQAYREGKFSTLLVDILSTGTFWPDTFLEIPDMESVTRSVSRETREFGYALLDNGLRLLKHEAELDEDREEDFLDSEGFAHGEDASVDGVDNVEKGARVIYVGDEQETGEMAASPVPDSIPGTMSARRREGQRQKFVTEYVRKGTRVVPEQIQINSLNRFASRLCWGYYPVPLDDLMPIQLRSEESRLSALCNFFYVFFESLQRLEKEYWMPLLALKMIVRRMHERSMERHHSKESEAWKWTRKEARAFLATMTTADPAASIEPPDEVSERAIQLTAQILTALEAVEHLVQILLLSDRIPTCMHMFSGRRFHFLLAAEANADVRRDIWHVMEEDMEEFFAKEQTKKKKRNSQKSSRNSSSEQANEKRKIKNNIKTGMFSVLEDLPA